MLGEELQGAGPRFIGGLLVISSGGEIHECVVRSRVGIKLVGNFEAQQLIIELAQVHSRRVQVQLSEMEQHRAGDSAGQLKGSLVGDTPRHHNVAPVVGSRRLKIWIGGRPQPRHPAAHAETGYSDAVVVDGRVLQQKVYGGIDVGANLRISEMLYRPGTVLQHLAADSMKQVGSHRRVARLGQPVADVLDKLVNAPTVLADHHRRKRLGSGGCADKKLHILVSHLDFIPKRWHGNLPPHS